MISIFCRILFLSLFLFKKRSRFSSKKKVSLSIMQALYPFMQEKVHLCKKGRPVRPAFPGISLYHLSIRDVPGGIGVQFHTRRVTRQKLIVALGTDHRTVVAAQFQRRQVQPAPRHQYHRLRGAGQAGNHGVCRAFQKGQLPEFCL